MTETWGEEPGLEDVVNYIRMFYNAWKDANQAWKATWAKMQSCGDIHWEEDVSLLQCSGDTSHPSKGGRFLNN